jgi:hypothetical protein
MIILVEKKRGNGLYSQKEAGLPLSGLSNPSDISFRSAKNFFTDLRDVGEILFFFKTPGGIVNTYAVDISKIALPASMNRKMWSYFAPEDAHRIRFAAFVEEGGRIGGKQYHGAQYYEPLVGASTAKELWDGIAAAFE